MSCMRTSSGSIWFRLYSNRATALLLSPSKPLLLLLGVGRSKWITWCCAVQHIHSSGMSTALKRDNTTLRLVDAHTPCSMSDSSLQLYTKVMSKSIPIYHMSTHLPSSVHTSVSSASAHSDDRQLKSISQHFLQFTLEQKRAANGCRGYRSIFKVQAHRMYTCFRVFKYMRMNQEDKVHCWPT
jgi:hypothetical protein